jgi:hypothetical protein
MTRVDPRATAPAEREELPNETVEPEASPTQVSAASMSNIPRPPRHDEMPPVRPKSGWQQPPISFESLPRRCTHIGRVFAAMSIHRYEVGTEWICPCGQVFKVAINSGGKNYLQMQEEIVEVERTEGAEDQRTSPPQAEDPTDA